MYQVYQIVFDVASKAIRNGIDPHLEMQTRKFYLEFGDRPDNRALAHLCAIVADLHNSGWAMIVTYIIKVKNGETLTSKIIPDGELDYWMLQDQIHEWICSKIDREGELYVS